jgi:hypothetical protein
MVILIFLFCLSLFIHIGTTSPEHSQARPWMRASWAAALGPQLGRAPPQICKHQVYRPAGIRRWPGPPGEKDQERKS